MSVPIAFMASETEVAQAALGRLVARYGSVAPEAAGVIVALGGNDYGLAAAISIIIFIIVGAVTVFNFRYTGQLEEVSENV